MTPIAQIAQIAQIAPDAAIVAPLQVETDQSSSAMGAPTAQDAAYFEQRLTGWREPHGDAWSSLIAGVDDFASTAGARWQQVLSAIGEPGSLEEPQELLKIQASLVEHSFLYEVIGKGIGKAVQNIDQLVHVQ